LAATTGDGSTKANGEIELWDVLTGQHIRTLRGHTARIVRAAFSPDGRRLASAGVDETVKLWDLRTGEEVLTLRDHRGLVWSVDFSSDGTRLLSASMDRTVRIWDARPLESETGQAYCTLQGHRGGGPQRRLQSRWAMVGLRGGG
jgi:WD40 repeat protein